MPSLQACRLTIPVVLELHFRTNAGYTEATVRAEWGSRDFTQLALIKIRKPPQTYDAQLVVLPPLKCEPREFLSGLVPDLVDIKTHAELLEAINELTLEGLAARSEPAAYPADPDDPPNTFRVYIAILNATDLAGWQFDIAYNPEILEVAEYGGYPDIHEGNFLKQGQHTNPHPL